MGMMVAGSTVTFKETEATGYWGGSRVDAGIEAADLGVGSGSSLGRSLLRGAGDADMKGMVRARKMRKVGRENFIVRYKRGLAFHEFLLFQENWGNYWGKQAGLVREQTVKLRSRTDEMKKII